MQQTDRAQTQLHGCPPLHLSAMVLVVREAEISAKPSTVWALVATLNWQEWDEDVKAVENIQGGGLVNGGSADLVLTSGARGTATFTDVRENEHFAYGAPLVGWGLLRAESSLSLTPIAGGERTHAKYTFKLAGLLGGLAHAANSQQVVGGTESGLRRIKELSEAAEGRCVLLNNASPQRTASGEKRMGIRGMAESQSECVGEGRARKSCRQQRPAHWGLKSLDPFAGILTLVDLYWQMRPVASGRLVCLAS